MDVPSLLFGAFERWLGGGGGSSVMIVERILRRSGREQAGKGDGVMGMAKEGEGGEEGEAGLCRYFFLFL
jgi:hypothetical protein